MKKFKRNLFISIAILAIILFAFLKLPLRSMNTIINVTDEKYDDYGAGSIKYPTDLKNQKGLYDITNFKLDKKDNSLEFKYTMSNLTNSDKGKNGFSNVLIDTYISTDSTGLTSTLEYGAVVRFNSEYPWKYHIRITPDNYTIEKLTNEQTRETEKIEGDVKVSGDTIILTIDSENIAENLIDAKYYVFTGGYDVFGDDYYRTVQDKEDTYKFSGGISSLYQPNVIDVVSPVQKDMLKNFMPPSYATLSPVCNQSYQKYIFQEYAIILWILLLIFSTFTTTREYRRLKLKK